MVTKINLHKNKIIKYRVKAFKIYIDEEDQTQLIEHSRLFSRKKDAKLYKNKIIKENYCNIRILKEVTEKWL